MVERNSHGIQRLDCDPYKFTEEKIASNYTKKDIITEATKLVAKKEYEKALEMIEPLGNYPENISTRLLLGRIHREIGDINLALEHYDYAYCCAKNPEDRVSASLGRAVTMKLVDNFSVAIEEGLLARKLISDVDSKYMDPLKRKVLYFLADTHYKSGDKNNAQVFLDEAKKDGVAEDKRYRKLEKKLSKDS